jgi:hypothetical protein
METESTAGPYSESNEYKPPFYFKSVLIILSHLRRDLQVVSSLQGADQNLNVFLISRCYTPCASHVPLIWSP